MLRPWSQPARQLIPRRRTVAHLGNLGCVHIHTGNLSLSYPTLTLNKLSTDRSSTIEKGAFRYWSIAWTATRAGSPALWRKEKEGNLYYKRRSTEKMLRPWSQPARQLIPRRRTVAHLGNLGCIHIHTGNLSLSYPTLTLNKLSIDCSLTIEKIAFPYWSTDWTATRAGSPALQNKKRHPL